MSSSSWHAEITVDKVRLDVYGEVFDPGRVATFLTADDAFAMSKALGLLAMRLRNSQLKKCKPEDFV